MIVRRILIAAALLMVASSGFAQMPSIELPPQFDRVLRDYERAWSARDAAALAQLFTEDGFVLSNGKPAVRGRSAIREAYAKSGGPLALRAFAYSADGNVGYIIGGYAGSKDAPDDGKFVLALRKDDAGRWLIAADIDNSNSRPRPSAPPPPPVVPPPPAESELEVRQASDQFWATRDRKDAAAFAAQFTEDGIFMVPGLTDAAGRTAIRELAQRRFAGVPVTDFKIHRREIEVTGDTAYELAWYSEIHRGAEQPLQLQGRYLIEWKRGSDKVWRVHRHLQNFARAEPAS